MTQFDDFIWSGNKILKLTCAYFLTRAVQGGILCIEDGVALFLL